MLIALFGLAALSQSPEATERSAPPPRAPGMTVAARSPSLPDGPTRVVCTRERAMDTNIQRRVCRRVPVNSSERERMASDMMKDMQRLGALPND